ncbi:MAG: AI-2E family transporter [Muribaculaceae bacterium]
MTEARRKYDFDRVVRIVFAAICVVVVVYLIDYLSGVLLPFFVACLVAYMLHPVMEFNRKLLRCKGYVVPAIFTLVLVTVVLGGMLWLLLPYVYDEVSSMVILLGEYTTRRLDVQYMPREIHDFVVQYIDTERIANLLSKEQWMKLIGNVFQRTWSFLGVTAGVIANICSWMVSVLYLIFILIDYDKIVKGVHSAVPMRYRGGVFRVIGDVKRCMSMYFRSQALIAFIVGVLFSIGFYIIGLPMAVVLGMFIGLLNLVPYLQLISIPIAIFLCLVDAVACGGNFWAMCAYTVIVYCVVQAIQDLVLTPRIMGKNMSINPVFILLSLSVWGTLLGFVGLIIALPLTALLISYYKQYLFYVDSHNADVKASGSDSAPNNVDEPQ